MPPRTPLISRVQSDPRLAEFLRDVALDIHALAQGRVRVADGFTAPPTTGQGTPAASGSCISKGSVR